MEHLSTVIAIPVFLIFILVEYFATRKSHPEYYRLNDALTNLNIGVSHLLFKLLTTGLMLGAYVWTAEHFAVIQLSGIWAYIVVLVLFDFCFYWAHRFGHEVNLFWGAHVVHHQSEEYNLTVALRQSWIHSLLAFIFFLPIVITSGPVIRELTAQGAASAPGIADIPAVVDFLTTWTAARLGDPVGQV